MTSKTRDDGLLGRWRATPLYLRILGAVGLGVVAGLGLGDGAAVLEAPAKLVLRLLGALAPPLILLAIVQALMRAHIGGRQALRLVSLLLVNTLTAILIGLAVANLVQPGAWTTAVPTAPVAKAASAADPLTQFFDSVPKSILGPFSDNGTVIGVIFIAVAFGVALRGLRTHEVGTVEDLVHVALTSLIAILHWIVDIVPLAVFGVVASIVGVKGFADFIALGGFVVAVLLALALQALYYAARVRLGSWVSPLALLSGTRDALAMAFSTGSSTVTMPVTYARLRDLGLRERSASMGALVGSNFNNDGTALYEAMSALFVAQLLGLHLSFGQQFAVVLTSVIASVGAAGIPEAGLVTMTMVFRAVALPTDYIALLLTVDWLLDRCRTTINVMGDMTVACLLDGKTREREGSLDPAAE
jgi:DAACS family dicarboxylate/amino acid:cation (Na+ or H+) symporter